MAKQRITIDKVKNTPAGGVLIGKDKEGQTIIPEDGSMGGFLVGKLHKEGGIEAINKSNGQPIEMQTNEVVITSPAVADTTLHNFDGKKMTNRQILSKINSDAGGVSFDGGGPIKKEYKTGGHLAENFSLRDIAEIHNTSIATLKKQVKKGLEVEKEHTSSAKERLLIVKDHLFENPKYYTILEKVGLKKGGTINLKTAAEKGDTPARDLNNYNDVLDLQADGDVGGDTGLMLEGGGELHQLNINIIPKHDTPFDKQAQKYINSYLFLKSKNKQKDFINFVIKNFGVNSKNKNYDVYTLIDLDNSKLYHFKSINDLYKTALNLDLENFHIVRENREKDTITYDYAIGNLFGDTDFDLYDEKGNLKEKVKNDAIKILQNYFNSDNMTPKKESFEWDTTFTSGFNKGQKLSEQEIETIDVYDDFIYGLNFKSGGSFDAKTEETIGLLSITDNPINLAVILEKNPSGFNTNAIKYNQKIKRRLYNLAEKSNRKIVLNNNPSSRINREFPYLLISKNNTENYDLATEFYEKLETPRNESRKKMFESLEKEKKESFESEGSTEGKGKLYEFFTPQIVADKMLALAQHYGFKGGNVLEPACGSGRLIKHLKSQNVTAFEISKDNFDILKREFPDADLHNFNFEKAFLKEPRFNTLINKGTGTWLKNAPFDLVLANPPYGKFSGMYSSYFKFKGQVEHFFILQSLYLLKKGGLGVYLIPSSFLRNGITYNDIKKQIFEIAELVDAYRLPTNIFEKTQIGTDILILRKK